MVRIFTFITLVTASMTLCLAENDKTLMLARNVKSKQLHEKLQHHIKNNDVTNTKEILNSLLSTVSDELSSDHKTNIINAALGSAKQEIKNQVGRGQFYLIKRLVQGIIPLAAGLFTLCYSGYDASSSIAYAPLSAAAALIGVAAHQFYLGFTHFDVQHALVKAHAIKNYLSKLKYKHQAQQTSETAPAAPEIQSEVQPEVEPEIQEDVIA